MGGSRCIFRDCQVSTQRNPKMHFFKLPVRDSARLETWLRNCGNADILNVAKEKLLNRAVCARHFRIECFMNYKMDRLIPNQIPTLVRISKELAWDLAHLDENGEATMVKLENPTSPHLIPPANFECPLGFLEDARFDRKLEAKKRTAPRPLAITAIKKERIMHDQEKESNNKINVLEIKHSDESGDDDAKSEKAETHIDAQVQEIFEKMDQIKSLSNQNLEELQLKYDRLKANFDQVSAENITLKESLVKLEALQQATKVNTTASSAPAPQLSKSQLYKGIRKYLGPSMGALVRMEMFGGGEREWKEDERIFAKELLQLGDNVYNHCSDEWRFRLPSIRMTRSWLENSNSVDNEDEDL